MMPTFMLPSFIVIRAIIAARPGAAVVVESRRRAMRFAGAGSSWRWRSRHPRARRRALRRPRPSSAGAAARDGPVILFLVDNSASLPPLDPEEKRVAALEKMFTFLEGRPYRLILFGGRQRDLRRRRHALPQQRPVDRLLLRLRQGARAHGGATRTGTEFRMILLTDAILDPQPRRTGRTWTCRPGADLQGHVVEQTLGAGRRR